MANEGATVATHVKILYCLVVVLIIGEIGSYYYSLYLYTNIQEECSRLRYGHPLPPLGSSPEPQPLVRRRRAQSEDENAEFFLSEQPGAVKGQLTEDKKFLWVNSYSRINVRALEKFCNDVTDFCGKLPQGPEGPPGPKGSDGPQGIQGVKGTKGDEGERGPKGEEGDLGYPGNPGQAGPPGPIGPKGERGKQGLDGRHGLAGEPGLDGISGTDGIPGRNGTNGTPGKPGPNGINGAVGPKGKAGVPGINGTPGTPGIKGEQGYTGQKGKKGLDGRPGTPGEPGVNVWMVNGSEAKTELIAPSIIDKDGMTTISVKEGSNLRLVCTASGKPPPVITWSKDDNGTVLQGSWHESAVRGSILNITHVVRQHMGRYSCTANNGIPPEDTKVINLEVTFGPFIEIQNKYVEARSKKFVLLECKIEAYPEPLNDWHDVTGNLIENSSFHHIIKEHSAHSKYKYSLKMILNVTDFKAGDVMEFVCVSRNAINTTEVNMIVVETAPLTTSGRVSVGTTPPKPVDYNDICGVQDACPTCPPAKDHLRCPSSVADVRLLGVGNNKTGDPSSVLVPRSNHCIVNKIGKPVFHRQTSSNFGAWMRDPRARVENQDKYWVTLHSDTSKLLEYASRALFRADKKSSTPYEKLEYPFQGNGQVVYNGRFYYHWNGTSHIVSLDLYNGSMKHLNIGQNTPNASLENGRRLYEANYTFVDLAADENGLWAVYGLKNNDSTVVIQFHPDKMEIIQTWVLSLNHTIIGDTFIAFGVLYVLDTTMSNMARIIVGFDLYENKVLDLDAGIEFTNPFSYNTMVSYNHLDKSIFSWDKGYQLVYPILFACSDPTIKPKMVADQPDRSTV